MSIDRRKSRRREGERGSALLIVFVFAAIIAIMLFMEMPVAVFEAKRQKEELLIDRGNEYAHAVKLFVRKTGTYPASIDALENTNNMRFLRHRFKDPFTGKDDWRLLHAGPGGMLIDSKVPQNVNLQNGGNGSSLQNGNQSSSAFGSNSNSFSSGGAFGNNSGNGFGNNSSNSFGSNGNNSFGSNGGSSSTSSASSDSAPEVVVPALKERAPAMAANGAGAPAATDDPLAPLLPTGADGNQASGNSGNSNSGNPNPSNANQTSGNQTASNQAGGATGTTPGQTTGSTGSSSTFGTINSGGIAGVASKASGPSIKEVNKQTNYALWEFFYDPTKDALRGIASALGSLGGGVQTNGSPGISSSGNNSAFGSSSAFGSNSAFGSSNTNSSFGSSSFSNNSPSSTTAPSGTTPQPNPQ